MPSNVCLMVRAGLGHVLVPLSSVLSGTATTLPPHITAALQSLAPGGAALPPPAPPLPVLPISQEPTPTQLLQQLAVNQMLQQATAAATAHLPQQQASSNYMPQPATAQAAPRAVAAGSLAAAPAVAPPAASAAPAGASLAALVPHVSRVAQHVHPVVAAAIAAKKALTAYLVFINAKREQVIKEHPEADLKDQVGFCRSHTLLSQTCSHVVCGRHSLLLRHTAMLSMKLPVWISHRSRLHCSMGMSLTSEAPRSILKQVSGSRLG